MVTNKAVSISIAAIFTILIVFFSGCTWFSECKVDEDCDPGAACNEGVCVSITFRPEGVVAEFLAGTPPESIHSEETFDVYLMLTNKGGYTVPANNVQLKMFGGNYDKSGVTVFTNKKPMRGAASYEPFGDAETVALQNVKYTGIAASGTSVPLVIGAQVMYDYQTTANATVCLASITDSNPFCSDAGNKLRRVSNSPVTVETVTERTYPKFIDFEIVAKHVGKGTVCKLGSVCTKKVDEGYINLEKVILGSGAGAIDYTSKCDKTAKISSETKTATFYCKSIGRLSTSSKEDVLDITLSYRYKEAATRDMSVIS